MRESRVPEANPPSRDVTSRVAEAFYWLGRYLERAYHQAYLNQVVETLETEELNSAERKLYRPMWGRLLPPLEKSAGESRRSITTRLDRYRLVLAREPGSVVSTFGRAMVNAESVQESLSPEAWATLSGLTLLFQKNKFRANISEEECARIARKVSEEVTQRIPQFFAIASRTVLGDDGWRFCEAGEMLERGSSPPTPWSRSANPSSASRTPRRSSFRPSCGCSARATPIGGSIRSGPNPLAFWKFSGSIPKRRARFAVA